MGAANQASKAHRYIMDLVGRATGANRKLLSEAATRLAEHPKLGRPGSISGTHELIPHESYRLVYEIEQETVWVLALVHTAKQWPPVRE